MTDNERSIPPSAAQASFSLGAMTLPYRNEPLERALEGIAAAGYSHVGLVPKHADQMLLPQNPSKEQIAGLRHTISKSGLIPWVKFGSPGVSRDRDLLNTDLEVCAEVGIAALLVVGPWQYEEGQRPKPVMSWYGEVEEFLRHLAAGAKVAERLGVTIVLKPHTGVSARGSDIVDVVGRIGSPAVRGCWDAGNIRFYEGLDSEDDLEQSGVASLLHTVCIKDHNGPAWEPDFPVPGEGDVDHLRMLRILAAAGYSGPLLVERVDQPTTQDNDAALARVHTFLQATIKEATDGGVRS